VNPTARHTLKWLLRYQLFDEYTDLTLRGRRSLATAMDSYLWVLGYSVEERGELLAMLSQAAKL
jgi:hypothetical protein